MAFVMFKKAKGLVTKVRPDVAWNNAKPNELHWNVGKYQVKLANSGRMFCTCEANSIWRVGGLCSHILAALVYQTLIGDKI